MDRVAQDGMRVRASAGACFFPPQTDAGRMPGRGRSPGRSVEDRSWSLTRRRPVAASRPPGKRAAEERRKRVQAGADADARSGSKKEERRKSTRPVSARPTPEATVMKMPDGGFPTGLQRAVRHRHQNAGDHRCEGSRTPAATKGEMLPMVEQHHSERYDKVPRRIPGRWRLREAGRHRTP